MNESLKRKFIVSNFDKKNKTKIFLNKHCKKNNYSAINVEFNIKTFLKHII